MTGRVLRQLAIDKIKIGARYREDMGDLDALAHSIEQSTLLHPIVITPGRTLVAGQRRLEACRKLGWVEVPVLEIAVMDDALSVLRAERDENLCRKDMTPSEKVALGRALEELERPKAAARKAATQAQPGIGKVGPDKLSGPTAQKQVREQVGEAVGMSGSTYQRAKAVVDRAESGDLVAQEAQQEMDRTGKVTPSYVRVVEGSKPKNARTKKQALETLRRALINIESAAAPFELEGFGDLESLVTYSEAQLPLDQLFDAHQRLSVGVRRLRRYASALKEAK